MTLCRRAALRLLIGCSVLMSPACSVKATTVGPLEVLTPPQPQLFAATSIWDTPLPKVAAKAGADDLAGRLARQAQYNDRGAPVKGLYATGFGVNINMQNYSVPVWTVPLGQPRVKVTLLDGAGAARPPGWARGLPEQLAEVPLPTGVGTLEARGSDGHVAIWQPSTDTYWEFWVFHTAPAGSRGPTARYGGRIQHVSASSGVLPNNWGARATSLALLGGVVRMGEYLRGVVPHALAVGLPAVSMVAVAPATRGDGPGASVASGSASAAAADAVPEGARFRLPSGYDCLGRVPAERPLVRILCAAARDYGMIVVDRTGGTVSFYAEDDKTVGTSFSDVTASPWPWVALGGPGSGLTDAFPWSDLTSVGPGT